MKQLDDYNTFNASLDSVYYGVVSLRGLRMMIFLDELDKLYTCATDICNVYLEEKKLEQGLYHCRVGVWGNIRKHITNI